MFALGPLTLLAPLALIGLLALPVIWLLLRATPPAPRRNIFPPLRLIFGLNPDEETPQRTPWWLILLRMAIAALIIIGLARPILFPPTPPEGEGPIVVVMDDGWASASDWDRMNRAGLARIDAARQAGRQVALVFTARAPGGAQDIIVEDAGDARRRLAAHEPRAWAPDRADAAARIEAAIESGALQRPAAPTWISDGVDHDESAAELAQTLASLGPGRVIAPAPIRAPLGLTPLEPIADGFAATVIRADGTGQREGVVTAYDADGRPLARAGFAFEDGETEARAETRLPLELRNRAAIARLESRPSAGATQILDDAWRRPLIGLVVSGSLEDRQPLLADLHYIERAMEASSQTRRGSLAELLALQPGALVLTDAGRIVGPDAEDVERYVAEGGLLIRFAGPRLAERSDDLVPTRLRSGGRALGGALGWDEPQPLAPFADDSPFAGLDIPQDVTVSRQVLAEPVAELDTLTWARLADGTPLVTAARRGRGRVVLFHVTAAPDWSNLPISGLFPEMMARVAAYASSSAPNEQEATGAAWRLDASLTAEGRLESAGVDARIEADAFNEAAASIDTPPGRYSRAGAARALNVLSEGATLAALPAMPAGLALVTETGPAPRPLGGPLLALALALLILDALAMGWLGGTFRGVGRRSAATAATALFALVMFAPGADAQDEPLSDDEFYMMALSELRLAYVITGDEDTDEMTRAGLVGLSRQLNRRTSIEPAEPLGVNLEVHDISVLPMLYWVVDEDTPAPSPEAAERLDLFLRTGGVLVIDTRDAATAAMRGGAPHPGLERIVETIDIPALAPVPDEHVLTRAFYLLSEFPGRWRDAPVWVEADTRGSARDGVSGVVVGGGDWAAAWAIDESGRPLAAVTPGGERQREIAYRFGINLVMYVLTGNYKSDQVHVPAILERLGQ